MLNRCIGAPDLFSSALMRLMISLARLPSLTMRSRASRASVMFGGWPASQRRPALALVTTAASGWLISCAIEAVISPSVVTRLIWASSDRACCSASSVWRARTAAVTSLAAPR